jgi:hypothetical protein
MKELTTCIDCPHHSVIGDPDPTDSFCDDDLAVVCKKEKNPCQNLDSKWLSDRSERRVVEPSIRPYKLRQEATVPSWCPLKV